MKIKFFLCFISLIWLASCASYFKRKECEQQNWYNYGYELAMKGMRPANDNFLNECRKAEAEIAETQLDHGFKEGMANYCKPEVVFQTGRKGEKINLDFCDPGQGRVLSQKHAEGVKAYCDPENAKNIGSSGTLYSGICPPELEKSFLPEYKKGRRKFLTVALAGAESSLRSKDSKLMMLISENSTLTSRLAVLPPPRTVIEKKWDPQINSYREESRVEDRYDSERRRLSAEIEYKQQEIKKVSQEKTNIENNISKYRTELATLD